MLFVTNSVQFYNECLTKRALNGLGVQHRRENYSNSEICRKTYANV